MSTYNFAVTALRLLCLAICLLALCPRPAEALPFEFGFSAGYGPRIRDAFDTGIDKFRSQPEAFPQSVQSNSGLRSMGSYEFYLNFYDAIDEANGIGLSVGRLVFPPVHIREAALDGSFARQEWNLAANLYVMINFRHEAAIRRHARFVYGFGFGVIPEAFWDAQISSNTTSVLAPRQVQSDSSSGAMIRAEMGFRQQITDFTLLGAFLRYSHAYMGPFSGSASGQGFTWYTMGNNGILALTDGQKALAVANSGDPALGYRQVSVISRRTLVTVSLFELVFSVGFRF